MNVKKCFAAAVLSLACTAAWADAVQALNQFVREVRSGSATFTQTVTTPDGKPGRSSIGSFEFQRPNRFRFAYAKPYEQLIVSDGRKVWFYDPDLSQVTVRDAAASLGATPAALLAGGDLAGRFTLQADGSAEGLEWVRVTPKQPDASVRQLRVGFKGQELAALEVLDGMGQRSLMRFAALQPQAKLAAERFRFAPPKGVDVIEQ